MIRESPGVDRRTTEVCQTSALCGNFPTRVLVKGHEVEKLRLALSQRDGAAI